MKYFFVFFIILLSCAFASGGGALGAGFPQRIVSLGPLNTENIYLLGAGDRLVGNTSYCVRPEAAKAKEKIGSVMQISIEKILSLQPDLILATGLTQPQQLKKLQELGLRVVQVQQPASFSEICKEFIRLGQARGDFIDVIDGLNAGETIVTSGVFKLRSGMKVIIDNTLAPKPSLEPQPSES